MLPDADCMAIPVAVRALGHRSLKIKTVACRVDHYCKGCIEGSCFLSFRGMSRCCFAFEFFFLLLINLSLNFIYFKDGNGVVRGYYLSVFLELSAGLPETSK